MELVQDVSLPEEVFCVKYEMESSGKEDSKL